MSEVKEVRFKKYLKKLQVPNDGITVRFHSYIFRRLVEHCPTNRMKGIKLVAIYAILLKNRTHSESYRSVHHLCNGRATGGYTLLSKNTGLSKSTLKKYVPILISHGLGYFTPSGSFIMTGSKKLQSLKQAYLNEKFNQGTTIIEGKKIYGIQTDREGKSKREGKNGSREMYKAKHRLKGVAFKLVPVTVGKLAPTMRSCISVLLHSEERKQKHMWTKKEELRDIDVRISNAKKGGKCTYSKKEKKRFEKAEENGFSLKKQVNHPIMSLHGLHNLCYGEESTDSMSVKNKGSYLRKVLKADAIFETRRRFNSLNDVPVSFETFKVLKRRYASQGVFNVIYHKGYVKQEVASEFNTINTTAVFDATTSSYKVIPAILKNSKPVPTHTHSYVHGQAYTHAHTCVLTHTGFF